MIKRKKIYLTVGAAITDMNSSEKTPGFKVWRRITGCWGSSDEGFGGRFGCATGWGDGGIMGLVPPFKNPDYQKSE